jgi:hypothetical protein
MGAREPEGDGAGGKALQEADALAVIDQAWPCRGGTDVRPGSQALLREFAGRGHSRQFPEALHRRSDRGADFVHLTGNRIRRAMFDGVQGIQPHRSPCQLAVPAGRTSPASMHNSHASGTANIFQSPSPWHTFRRPQLAHLYFFRVGTRSIGCYQRGRIVASAMNCYHASRHLRD